MEIDLPILILSNLTKLAIKKPPSLMRDEGFFSFQKVFKKFFMDIAIWKLIYIWNFSFKHNFLFANTKLIGSSSDIFLQYKWRKIRYRKYITIICQSIHSQNHLAIIYIYIYIYKYIYLVNTRGAGFLVAFIGYPMIVVWLI